MDGKSQRGRGWGANKKLKEFPKSGEIFDDQGNVDKDKFDTMLAWMYQYARDMQSWGQDVRDDILRLEGHAGFASGDPGDPPDGPPNGEEEE